MLGAGVPGIKKFENSYFSNCIIEMTVFINYLWPLKTITSEC